LVSSYKKSFGFVVVDGVKDDYYIAAENVNGAVDGDEVIHTGEIRGVFAFRNQFLKAFDGLLVFVVAERTKGVDEFFAGGTLSLFGEGRVDLRTEPVDHFLRNRGRTDNLSSNPIEQIDKQHKPPAAPQGLPLNQFIGESRAQTQFNENAHSDTDFLSVIHSGYTPFR